MNQIRVSLFFSKLMTFKGFPGDSDSTQSVCNEGEQGLIPGLQVEPLPVSHYGSLGVKS